jgi:hypothetical protein
MKMAKPYIGKVTFGSASLQEKLQECFDKLYGKGKYKVMPVPIDLKKQK